MTTWLWVGLAGAALQLVALGSDFYTVKGEAKDAWLGIPHASDLILLSAIVAIALIALTAAGRNPVRGRNVGLAIGIAGCVLVALAGFLHAFSSRGRETPARPALAATQPGMTPWLGVAGIGAVAQFVFGFTFFTTYITEAKGGGNAIWSGWIPTPHTSSLVLAISVIVLLLVRAAGRERSPLSPSALGGMIAVLGFVAGVRISYRLVEPPFGTVGTEIGLAGYLSVVGALVVVIAGIVQAQSHREPGRAPEPAGST